MEMHSNSSDSRERIGAPTHHKHVPVLDGVRGLAIFLVLCDHFTVLLPHSLFDRCVVTLARLGPVGVDLFFVLSGFLITGILFDAKGTKSYFRKFYARRTVRIFPLYYAVVAFCLLILPHIPNAKASNFGHVQGSEIWYWTYLSNFSIAAHGFRHGILDVSWSLAIEEQFYLIWPFAVFLLDRKWLVRLCCFVFFLAIVIRAWIVLRGGTDLAIYVLTPCRMDGLAVGAFVALTVRGAVASQTAFKRGLAVAGLAGAVFITLVVLRLCESGNSGLIGYGEIPRQSAERSYQIFSYAAVTLFFGATLATIVLGRANVILTRVLSATWLRWLGRYSYAIYLFNLPLRALLRDAIFSPQRFPTIAGTQFFAQLAFYVLASALVFPLAWLSWQLFEKHFVRLKRFFPS